MWWSCSPHFDAHCSHDNKQQVRSAKCCTFVQLYVILVEVTNDSHALILLYLKSSNYQKWFKFHKWWTNIKVIQRKGIALETWFILDPFGAKSRVLTHHELFSICVIGSLSREWGTPFHGEYYKFWTVFFFSLLQTKPTRRHFIARGKEKPKENTSRMKVILSIWAQHPSKVEKHPKGDTSPMREQEQSHKETHHTGHKNEKLCNSQCSTTA